MQGEEAGEGVHKADVVQALESTLEQLQVHFCAHDIETVKVLLPQQPYPPGST